MPNPHFPLLAYPQFLEPLTENANTMNAWLAKVSERLTDPMRAGLERLLVVPEGATESAFADLCRPAKRPSLDHLDEAIEQLNRVIDLALPKDVLAEVPVSRIEAWTEEARRLTATELREYVQPRRHALLICLRSQIRASRFDDLVTILIRFIGRIEAKARGDLDAWHRKRRMKPTRTVLESLYNTDRWIGWTRHLGPPGRLSSQIENRQRRCVLTSFAVGSGLGATQAARHIDEPISPHLLSFVQRRHMGTGSLRAACTDILNQYAKFELPTYWGPTDKVAADGSLLTTYEDNIQASYHVRYRRTGAVAYRHVGTNYIAYFTNFIVADAYEGAHLFDALQMNESKHHLGHRAESRPP